MRSFTENRSAESTDEIWLLQHEAVFTQGLGGKDEHILNPRGIPVIRTDRGGQVTYHGPGQLMVYLLLDLNRLNLNTRAFVRKIENIIIHFLQDRGISAHGNADAPGVYVNGAKICSVGLRIRRGFAYHGLAFNISMDLTPFSDINPCGFQGLKMTQVNDYHSADVASVQQSLIPYLINGFGYNESEIHKPSGLVTP